MAYRPGDLEALLEQVCDQQSFLAFVDALAGDFALERELEAREPSSPYGPGRLGWENGTVDAVFEAAAAFGEASSGKWTAEGGNVWRRCVEILFMGKYYE